MAQHRGVFLMGSQRVSVTLVDSTALGIVGTGILIPRDTLQVGAVIEGVLMGEMTTKAAPVGNLTFSIIVNSATLLSGTAGSLPTVVPNILPFRVTYRMTVRDRTGISNLAISYKLEPLLNQPNTRFTTVGVGLANLAIDADNTFETGAQWATADVDNSVLAKQHYITVAGI
jgi:hypothetical protein